MTCRRVGLRALLLVGTSPRRVLLGFMLPTAVLSMWISNTATTAMMIPILEVDSSPCLRITEYPPPRRCWWSWAPSTAP